MKRYIVSKTDNRQYYTVTFGWDEGDAESGPIVKVDKIIVKARSKQDAEQKVSRKMDADCYAQLASQEDIDEFVAEMKKSEDEYQSLLDAGLIDPEIDAEMNEARSTDKFKKMSMSELRDYYQRFEKGYFDSFSDWYDSLRAEGKR